MAYYIALSCLGALYCLTLHYCSLARNKLIHYLPLIVLIALFVGLRDYEIGTDTYSYFDIYKSIAPIDIALLKNYFGWPQERYEIGFVALISFLKWLGLPFSFFLVLVNALLLSLVVKAYIKFLEEPHWAIFFFLCTITALSYQYNVLRQGVAAASCLLAYAYFAKGRWFSMLLCILLAFAFHSIAALVIVPILLHKFKWKPWYGILFCLVAIILAKVDFLGEILEKLQAYSVVLYRVYNYFSTQQEDLRVVSVAVLLSGVVLLLAIILVERLRQENEKVDNVITYVMTGYLSLLAFHELSLLAIRSNYLFAIAEPMLVTMLVSLIKDSYLKAAALIFLGLLLLSKNVYITGNFLSPYSSIYF